jgi:hypothetical protein
MPVGDVMEQSPEPNNTAWLFPFAQQDWGYTLPAVQASNEASCGYLSAKAVRSIDA